MLNVEMTPAAVNAGLNSLSVGMTVEVYRNLRRPGYFSVRAKITGKKVVIAHLTAVALSDVKFVVQESGRQRSITKQREVHAWLTGTIAEMTADSGQYVRYNPFICGSFHVADTGAELSTASAVVMRDCGVYL